MTVQTFDNYSLIENVLTDAQINTLIEWWDNKEYLLDADGNPEVGDRNYWELGLDLKQKIESNIRQYVCSIQLSDASDYTGGDLQICKYINDLISTAEYQTPTRVKASAIIYDNRAVHNVTEITSGTRYSINECAG